MSQTKDQDEIAMLRSEIAYLKGKVSVYEKFLKDKGFIKEEEITYFHYERQNDYEVIGTIHENPELLEDK